MKQFSTFLCALCLLSNLQASIPLSDEEVAKRLGVTVQELAEMRSNPVANYVDDGWHDGEGGIDVAESRQVTPEDWDEALAFNPLLQVLPEPFQAIQLLPPESTEDNALESARAINLQMIDGLAEHLAASEAQIVAAKAKLELFLQEHQRIATAAGAA